MKYAVVIPAAGLSSRFAGNTKKPFEELAGRAIWLRTVEHFESRDDVSEVVLVLAEDDIADFKQQFQGNLAFLNVQVTVGGSCRAESVLNGINALQQPADFVAVHDAARPLLTKQWITEIFAAAADKGAVVPGIPVSSTVKKVSEEGQITETIDRSALRLAQTPQVFQRQMLEDAFAATRDLSVFTDEASVLEAAGHPVFVHAGWPMNIKITTQDDISLAEAFLKALPSQGGLGNVGLFD